MSADGTVLVTGAASGMGLGIAELFAERGHAVVMLDRSGEAVEAEAARIREAGGNAVAWQADVSDRARMDTIYAEARERLGPVTIVIANAGISGAAPFATMPWEVWHRMIDINLNGVFHTIQPAIADMLTARWGRIVTISSQAGQSGAQDRAHYAAAKAGVIGLTRALAREFGPHGVTVNTIPPSLVDTPMAQEGVRNAEVPSIEALASMLPIPRAGTPRDIAEACLFLCSDRASYITGQEINVNGGSWM